MTVLALDDPARLAAVQAVRLLDTAPEESFDRFARLAARLLDAPTTIVSLIDDRRQFIKSAIGLGEPWNTTREAPLTHSLCKTVVATNTDLLIEDGRADRRVQSDPYLRELGIVSYAGVPLVTDHGLALGAVCALDTRPRRWSERDVETLRLLSESVMTEIHLRAANESLVRPLEAAHAEIDALFAHLPVGVVLFDRDLRFRRVNQHFANIVGAPIETHFGKRILDLLPNPPPNAEATFRRVLETGIPLFDVEFIGETPAQAGVSREWRTTIFPMRRRDGVITGVAGVVMEITKERQAERKRRELDALFHDILHNAPLSIFVRERDGQIVLANQAATELMERSPHELVAETLGRDDGEAREAGHPIACEQAMLRDGMTHYVHAVKFPVRKEHGYDDAVVSIGLDITEQVWSQKRIRLLARLGANFLAHTDPETALVEVAGLLVPEFADWSIFYVRDKAGTPRLVGSAHADPRLAGLLAKVDEEFRLEPEPPKALMRAFETGEAELTENVSEAMHTRIAQRPELQALLERLGPAAFMMLPVIVHGRVEAVLGLFMGRASKRRYFMEDLVFGREIAARLSVSFESYRLLADRAEALRQLERANADLERRVHERTVALTKQNEALAAARESAERANTTKGEFLARMSHEIRTPLNGVLGMAALLLESCLTDDQRDLLRTLRASADSLLTILNEILDFSKIDAGRVRLEEQPFNLRTCVKDAIDLFSATAARKKLGLAVRFDEQVPRGVRGDPTRLRQVLTNLIGNAVKFTDKGEITVTVSAEVAPCGRADVRFDVRDSGIGITPEQRTRLFSPFTQGSTSTTRLFGGTGLGLAISKHLVELMGGRIDVESEAGIGTTFSVHVPLAQAALEAISEEVQREFDGQLAHRSPLRILVAEDNLVNQKVAVRMLALFGYDVDVVANGAEAIHAAMSRPYDLVFMDVQMPILDGLEASRRLRSAALSWPQPRIVAMTASSFDEDRTRCAEAGMDDFVSKPVRAAELEDALRRAVAALRAQGLASLAAPPSSKESVLGPAVDVTVLARLEAFTGGGVQVAELASNYLKNVRSAIPRVELALQALEGESVLDCMHRAVDGAEMLGARRLARVAKSLTESIRVHDFWSARGLAKDFRTEFERLEDWFASWRRGRAPHEQAAPHAQT